MYRHIIWDWNGTLLDDARLFGRDWGFRLADVAVPVQWWHGDADSIIGLADAQASGRQNRRPT